VRGPSALVLLLCAALWGAIAPLLRAQQADPPLLILLSFDGWRWDYHTRVPVRNLQRLMARGVRARALIPSFPTKTFPNHYTIVTGLYPGHHGIVANNIRDDATGRTFTLSTPKEVTDAMWWGGEPIWVTAERAGQKTATMFWPGSEAPIDGVRPTYYEAYNEDLPGSERVKWVLERLDAPPGERPAFLTLYFEDVDTAGHADGPDSQAVRDATIRADAYLGQLVDGLDRRGLLERANIVVVSDHGMAPTSPGRVIQVDDYISLDDVVISDINPGLGVFPKPGREASVYRALRNAHPRLNVFRRSTTPARWHYRDHPRVPPIVAVADEGWQVLTRRATADIRSGRVRASGGQHGYDPRLTSMHGLFVAAGPAFKAGVEVPAFENVQIYNVLARVLGVTPAPNDGTAGFAGTLLRQDIATRTVE
jgi:predicted AlkP superfamily pyrophosphatase or phosphodiesterase